jgi:type II secretory pathway pseudopilin PulG
MGIEVAIGAIAAAASVVTGVMSYSQAAKAARERKEANNVANAQQQNDAAASRRKAAREARVRRAMIMQQSENAGLGIGGSGTQGAIGVVNTNLGSNNSQSLGQSLSAKTINRHNQRAADYDFKAAAWGSFGNIFNSALTSFSQPQKQT